MEITLRKARKIETAINTFLDENTIVLETSIRVLGTFDEAKESLSVEKKELLNTLSLRQELLKIRYGLRRKIEVSNESSGINDLINKKVLNEKLISELDNFIQNNKQQSLIELQDTLTAHSKLEPEKYSFKIKTTFYFPILQNEDTIALKDKKISLKKDIEKIEDELSFLNLNTKIILEEDATKLLEFNKIL
jgi:hypothetical protein